MNNLSFRKPLSFLLPDQHYLDQGGTTAVDFTTDAANPQIVLTGTIGKNILFFGCNRFSLSASFHAGNNSVYPLLSAFFENLRKDSVYKGIILDLRDNPGGDLADLNFFCGQFMGQPVVTSSVEFRYVDGKVYEGKGFPPDIVVPFDLAALGSGVDPQLEMAISLLK